MNHKCAQGTSQLCRVRSAKEQFVQSLGSLCLNAGDYTVNARYMKKLLLSLMLMMFFGIGHAQNLILSTDQGKNCSVNVSTDKIKDNILNVTLRVSWVSDQMKPVVDRMSVVAFEADRIVHNQPGLISLVAPADQKVIAFNSEMKLSFLFDERFLSGDVSFRFPFFYATSKEAANDPKSREEFTLKRPKDFALAMNIPAGVIIDKNPPLMAILTPEGVDEGLKPITDSTLFSVVLAAKDKNGIQKVVVNNQPATPIDDSTYAVKVNLKAGYENTLVAIATDGRGLESRKEFKVECRLPQPKAKVIETIAEVKPKPEEFKSDVDIDIPETGETHSYRFALIIGNEDYQSYQTSLNAEMNVAFAIRDAETFKEYAVKVLGVPEPNVIMYKNAKALEMHRALNQINSIIKSTKGQGEFFVYYAGHGFPDEQTKEPYLVPVDVSGTDLQFAIKLTDFYKKLSEYPSQRVTVFLDACFSGGGRELGLLAARGVKVKPREAVFTGKLIVLTASSGDQSALPYPEKRHGMFTYHLLRKLKETQGDVTYQELSDYITSNVSIRSVMVNNKEQNPQTNVSYEVGDKWKEWKVK